jgi:hypothetical protein
MGRKITEGSCSPPRHDHESLFKDRTGALVLVEQPYFGGASEHILETTGDTVAAQNAYDADIAELTAQSQAFAQEWDLAVRLSIEESWHYPGKTILVEYRKAVRR